jgi:tRNA (guanine37-N1)-methyltransferase
MKFDIISIFPQFFDSALSYGMVRIAQNRKVITVRITNPRDFTDDGVVDDYQFGGGAGMVMKPEPLGKAISHLHTKKSFLLYLTPKGKCLNQKIVDNLSKKSHIIIICGRYKGIDERINSLFHPLELSLGDYILSGGEVGALVLIEAITRLLPNVLGNRDSATTDSFQHDLFEAPIYTRPPVYQRFCVPDVLRSGNHQLVARWRRKKSLETTLSQRPDLLSSEIFSKKDFEMLLEVLNGENSRD